MEIVNMILSHHTVNHFPFLGIEENFRNRTIYYQTLGQLLFMNNFHTNRFDEFMTPFRQSFELLCSQPNMETLKQPEFKVPLYYFYFNKKNIINNILIV